MTDIIQNIAIIMNSWKSLLLCLRSYNALTADEAIIIFRYEIIKRYIIKLIADIFLSAVELTVDIGVLNTHIEAVYITPSIIRYTSRLLS